MSGFDPRQLRSAFGTFMTGVTVVTALSDDDTPVGFTANSYTSVSLDPPMLLVCPAKSLSSFSVFDRCQHFAVSVLAQNQQDISNIFASTKSERFAQVVWQADEWGCPIIDGAVSSFSCSAHQRIEAGDHVILVGRINGFQSTGVAGLGYSNGGYFSLGMERRAQEAPEPNHAAMVGAIIEHDGRVLMEETPEGSRPPQFAATGRVGSLEAISRSLSDAGMEVELGAVYSIFENKKTGEVFTYYRGTTRDDNPRGLGRYIAIDEIASLRFSSSGLAGMMRRYVLERRNGVFGLYMGSEVEGDVHMFGEVPDP